MNATVTGWSIPARLGLSGKWLRGTRLCIKRQSWETGYLAVSVLRGKKKLLGFSKSQSQRNHGDAQTDAWNRPPIHPSTHSQDSSRAVPGPQALSPGLENSKWAKPDRVPAFAELKSKGEMDHTVITQESYSFDRSS